MVYADENGVAQTSNSSPKNGQDKLAPLTETTMASSTKYESVVLGSEDKVENIMEEVRDEEKSVTVVTNEETAIEKEDDGEHAFEEEEEEEEVEEEEEQQQEQEEEEKEKPKEEKDEDVMEIEEAGIKKEEKNKEKVDANSNNVRKSRKRNRRKKVAQVGAEQTANNDGDKPESSGKKKGSKKAESMGMIFMCSSKTKKDCYRYKVLGLPANKKDMVQKVYKGMRLFLFDFDLRLMYGIYKAAGPGGSNIEPKAFKSAFPSQVRFTVLEDCLPLAEEKFKKVIKDNYYSKNKFNCLLNSEQVKNLCKLFVAASKGTKSQKVGRSHRPEEHTSAGRGRIKRRDRDEERSSTLGRERRYRERPVMYEREVFASPMAPVSRRHPLPPLAGPLYAYDRTMERDAYRREPALEHHGVRLLDLEPRSRDEIVSRDPYLSYREREAPSYHEAVYSSDIRREYYAPTALPAEYRTTTTRPAEYRFAGLPVEHRSSAAVVPAEHYASSGLLREYRAAGVLSEYPSSADPVREYNRPGTMYRY